MVCFAPPPGDERGKAPGEPGLVMDVLILVATVALSLATALVTASGILSFLLRVMVRLR